MRNVLFYILSLFFCLQVNAQQLLLKGKIIDKDTHEKLPFVNVFCKENPSIGTSTDTLGVFTLSVPDTCTQLVISFVSYENQMVPVQKFLKKQAYVVTLSSQLNHIQELRVRPGKNPAHTLLKGINDNKKRNNPNEVSPVDVVVYNNTAIALEHLDAELMSNAAFGNLNKVLISVNDTSMLMPLLVSEELQKIERNSITNTDINKQLAITNNGLSFFHSPDMMAFVAPITDRVNFYQNYIHVMNRDFASPLAFNGPINYRYYITDTLKKLNRPQYKVIFESRHPKDLAFNGYFWVEDGSFAVTDIKAELNPRANVNMIKQLRIHNVFEPVNDTSWFYKKQDVYITFKYHISDDTTKKQLTLVANKTAHFYPSTSPNYHLSEKLTQKTNKVLQNKQQSVLMMAPFRALEKDTLYQELDQSLTAMKQHPLINQVEKLMDMGLKGYYHAGKLDIGPFLDFYRKNSIEGDRITLPLRTSNEVSENFSVGGFYGYGVKNKKSKYGGNLFLKHPRTLYDVLGFSYWTDITNIGHNDHLSLVKENAYSYGEDNLISSMFQINENLNLSKKSQFNVFLEHDWQKGLSSKLKYENNRVHEGTFLPFTKSKGAQAIPYIDYNEVALITRVSFNEDYYDAFFHRLYFGNRYPVIQLKLAAGNYTTGFDAQNYYSAHIAFKHKLIFGSMFLRYMIEAGHIFGNVPFPLLELHRGNETYGYARYYYNLLRNMEYASDSYINIHSTLYMNGIVLNKIPIIRFLELREVVSFKGIVGSLSDKHKQIMDFPDGLSAVQSPYAEVGIGVTNLLRIFRIEYVKRLTDTNKPGIWTDGIRFRMEFNF